MIIQAIIVEEERNRPESALISNLGQPWIFDRNPFGISGIEHATFCGTKPELRPDQPLSPRITARQEIVLSKGGCVSTVSRRKSGFSGFFALRRLLCPKTVLESNTMYTHHPNSSSEQFIVGATRR